MYSSPYQKLYSNSQNRCGRNNFRTREIRVHLTSDESRRSDSNAGNYAGTSDASWSSFVGWKPLSGPREAKHFAARLRSPSIHASSFSTSLRYLVHFSRTFASLLLLRRGRIWTFTGRRVKAASRSPIRVIPIKSYKSLGEKKDYLSHDNRVIRK